VAQEIESYREKQMDNVDQEVRQLVVDISREALGRAIEPKDHEEMVRQALEKLT
jgi:F0F1-type ATP synthase membrane subunit b/b'